MIKVDTSGLDDLISQLEALQNGGIAEAIKEGAEATADKIIENADQTTHASFKGGFKKEVEQDGDTTTIAISNDIPGFRFWEYGTVHQPPNYSLVKAIQRNSKMELVRQKVEEKINKALNGGNN
jgi:hypothetical protein